MRLLPSFLLLVCAGTAAAQIDEQPPVMRRSPTSPVEQPSAGSKSTGKKQPDTMTGEGIVRHIDSKTVEVAIDDGRIFKAAIDSKTTFSGPAGKIDPQTVTNGTRVRISVKSNDEMDLTATSLVVEKPTVAGERVETPEEDASTRKTEDADPDRPVLKHGMPTAKKDDAAKKDDEEEEAPIAVAAKAADSVAPEPKDDSLASALGAENQPDLLNKAREANKEFVAHLPNFVVQQFTTRYERENKIAGWQAKDIISATVVYESGKERYDNIKINNRAANSDMMAIKGSRSTGEFGSILEGMFARDVSTEFRYLHAESIHQVHTKVFAYSVKRERTDWTIAEGGQSIEPAYSGRVWINNETGRVMRIERQADSIPTSFPLDLVEETVDYDFVMLGARKVLLPVESSVLMCERGASFCAKNVLQFRDYKEFRGAATVTFDNK